jgi:hypothetical protein
MVPSHEGLGTAGFGKRGEGFQGPLSPRYAYAVVGQEPWAQRRRRGDGGGADGGRARGAG